MLQLPRVTGQGDSSQPRQQETCILGPAAAGFGPHGGKALSCQRRLHSGDLRARAGGADTWQTLGSWPHAVVWPRSLVPQPHLQHDAGIVPWYSRDPWTLKPAGPGAKRHSIGAEAMTIPLQPLIHPVVMYLCRHSAGDGRLTPAAASAPFICVVRKDLIALPGCFQNFPSACLRLPSQELVHTQLSRVVRSCYTALRPAGPPGQAHKNPERALP